MGLKTILLKAFFEIKKGLCQNNDYKVCLYKTIAILCFPPCTPIKLPIYVSRNTMQKCNYLLQKKLSSWPLSQAPFQWEGTGPRPSSLKLSDSGHTPFHHRERIERKKRQIPKALIQKQHLYDSSQTDNKNTALYTWWTLNRLWATNGVAASFEFRCVYHMSKFPRAKSMQKKFGGEESLDGLVG
jgi:hypothetical protein